MFSCVTESANLSHPQTHLWSRQPIFHILKYIYLFCFQFGDCLRFVFNFFLCLFFIYFIPFHLYQFPCIPITFLYSASIYTEPNTYSRLFITITDQYSAARSLSDCVFEASSIAISSANHQYSTEKSPSQTAKYVTLLWFTPLIFYPTSHPFL